MFFFKKKEIDENKRFVVVFGTTPLAKFLTYILQQNNFEVVIFSAIKKDKKVKTEEYVFKNNMQRQSFFVDIVNVLDKKPEYCFLASSVDEYKNDLLALSDDIFKGVKIINFTSFYNHEIVDQMHNIKEIRAYFNGWLLNDKKDIVLFNRGAEISICCKEEDLSDIQLLLSDKKLNIKVEKNTKKLFLQMFIPWFLGNLLILIYQKDISLLMTDNKIRQNLDNVVKEILNLLKAKEAHVDESFILPDIYAFPDKYVSEFDSLKGVGGFLNTIKGIDSFNYPKTFDLINMLLKKY